MYICIIRVNVGQGMPKKCVCANDLIGIWNMCMRLKCCLELRDIVDMFDNCNDHEKKLIN